MTSPTLFSDALAMLEEAAQHMTDPLPLEEDNARDRLVDLCIEMGTIYGGEIEDDPDVDSAEQWEED